MIETEVQSCIGTPINPGYKIWIVIVQSECEMGQMKS